MGSLIRRIHFVIRFWVAAKLTHTHTHTYIYIYELMSNILSLVYYLMEYQPFRVI